MIEVEITEDVQAKAKAIVNGKFSDNGNLISAIGAVVVADYYGVDVAEGFKGREATCDMVVGLSLIHI